MTEMSQQALITAIINKGNELIVLAKGASIFRASVAYIVQQVHSFLLAIKQVSSRVFSNTQLQTIKQVHVLFTHFGMLLPHLSVDKWIQPALNWPADYVHKYIDGFRKSLIQMIPIFGLKVEDVIQYDESQEQVNKRADLKGLRSSLQALMAQVDTSDAVGVQQQIETKLAEIKRLLPSEGRRRGGARRPSCDSLPVVQMKRRVEELLGQFKNINIPIEDIELQSQIGAGGFGTVFKATRLSTSEVVAVKELRQDRLTMSSWASLYAEVETMASVRHQFVLELVGAHITEPYRIITRFCPGKSLFDRLHRVPAGQPTLTNTELTKIAYQVAVGMAHLHSLSIVHRDLKTLNILLDEYQDGLVADFGLSGMMRDNQELVGGVGTPHYTAPEVLMHQRYGPKVDTFSYGVVLWEMLMRKVPYSDMSQMQIYEHVVTRGWRLPIPNDSPEGMKKLIARCWNKNPNDRPNFDEIVALFESGEVAFVDCEKIDFKAIKATRHCPPLDFEYALEVLQDPGNDHFSSISYFLVNRIDEKVKKWLRNNRIVERLAKSENNIDAILLLASVVLDGAKEFKDFMEDGGLNLFKQCLDSGRGQFVSAAVKFGLHVQDDMLPTLSKFLPKIIGYLTPINGSTNEHIIQFLTRFDESEIKGYFDKIGKALVSIAADVDDQQTFDAIATLLKPCRSSLNSIELHSFYHLISNNFVIPPSFAETLIQANDEANRPELIFNLLKATEKSDVTQVLIKLLQQCLHSDQTVFQRLAKNPDLLPTLVNLIEKGHDSGALFVIFCISGLDEVRKTLADHKLLTVMLQMKTRYVQRLQIFTILCLSETFCLMTSHIDGIIHLLVSALSDKALIVATVRLIGALSSHPTGVNVLMENGVLELFAQLFLSSSSGDTATSHTIMRNVAMNGGEIPQVSLVVSCLMQDMISDGARKDEIMATATALVEKMPGCIQEHDLQKIVLPLVTPNQQPQLVLLALKMFGVCEPVKLRGFYPQVLHSAYNVLESPQMMYPDIIEAALGAIRAVGETCNLSEFVEKTQLAKFVEDVSALLGNDKRAARLKRTLTMITANKAQSNALVQETSSILV